MIKFIVVFFLRKKGQSLDPEMFDRRLTFGGGKMVMFWAAISGSGSSYITPIESTMDSKAFRKVILSFIKWRRPSKRRHGEVHLLQDNAPSHTARASKDLYPILPLNIIQLPPASPDLNTDLKISLGQYY